MHYDLIIIGMGLSGLMAAKTAVEMGGKVLIIGKGVGTLCLFSNTIDLLGVSPPMRSKGTRMKDSLSRWIKDHPEHPYAKIGIKGIQEALSSFISLFPTPYSFHSFDDENCLIPTGMGTFRPTYLIPNTMVGGTFLKERDALIVGFKGFKDFYPAYCAKPLGCQGIVLDFPKVLHQELTATALARLLEERSLRETIGKEIKKHLHGETRVGFPALLGIRDPFKVKKDFEGIIGVEVFEIPILPPSIPGMRIFNHFKEWLIQRGGNFLLGHAVLNAMVRGRKCEGVDIFNPPISNSYSADRYILATGRFISGGLIADEQRIFEPIFNLPVIQPDSREKWFENLFFNSSPHPIHRSGLLTDSSLRPIVGKGDLILENVWVAGSLLAHHSCLNEKSREGIEITTGYAAAKRALGS